MQMLGMAAMGATAERVIPNGRVWFIPQKVQLYTLKEYGEYITLEQMYLHRAKIDFHFAEIQRELAYRAAATIDALMQGNLPQIRD